MKPRVYIETTIPSYLTAWPSRDLIRAAQQQATRDWWAKREDFDLVISQEVLDECSQGDPTAAAPRLAALAGIPLLVSADGLAPLAAAIASHASFPAKAALDAVHVAYAAIHGIEFLLTWNCKHIANPILRPRIEAACREHGVEPPTICTPAEFLPTMETTDD